MKIQFAGGEPLMNYGLICRIFEYTQIHGYDVQFQLQTNGTLIDREIAAGLKKMRIAVGVSLDGPPEVNEMLRGGTKLAVNGIQNLARAGIIINVNSVVAAQNVERLYELLDFSLYLGNVAGIGLDLIRLAGRASKESCVLQKSSADQLRASLVKLNQRSESLYKKTGRKIAIREIEEAKKRLSCSSCGKHYCYASCGWSYVVLPGGDVYPCGSLIDHMDYYMGNIFDGQIRNIALTGSANSERCVQCPFFSFCPGGCPSRMITNEYESIQDSLDCVLKKTAFEIVSAK